MVEAGTQTEKSEREEESKERLEAVAIKMTFYNSNIEMLVLGSKQKTRKEEGEVARNQETLQVKERSRVEKRKKEEAVSWSTVVRRSKK